MGEYAKYKGEKIKIGTCNEMYYLRYDQRHLVTPIPGNVDPVKQINSIWFRAPRNDEKDIAPGEFEYYGYCGSKPIRIYLNTKDENYANELEKFCLNNPDIVQLKNEKMGVLVNINCYHGYKGENGENVHYNGWNSNTLGIAAIGFREGRAYALICCIACGHTFAKFDLDDLKHFAPFGNDRENFNLVIQQMIEMERSEI